MSVQFVDLVDNTTGSHQASKLSVPVVANSVATASIPALSFYLRVPVGNASTNISVVAPCDLEIISARAIKTAANGGAGDLVQVFNGVTAVTDALDLNVVDTTIVFAATINDAVSSFAEGDVITVDPTDVTNPTCILLIECISV